MTNSESDFSEVSFRDLVMRLGETLHAHLGRHDELAALLRRKKEAMVHLRNDELAEALDLERELIGAIGAGEEERLRVTEELARRLGKPRGAELRLRELVQHVDDDLQEELLDLRERIRIVAAEIERLNEVNRTLTVQSLDHANLYLAMLAGKDPEAKVYGKSGVEEDDGMPSILLDRRV